MKRERHLVSLDNMDLSFFDDAHLDDPDVASAFATIGGLIYEQNENAAAAAELYREVLKADSEGRDALLRIASFLHETLHRYESAHRLYLLLLEHAPDDAIVQINAAESALNCGKMQDVRNLTAKTVSDAVPSFRLAARVLRALAALYTGDKHEFELDANVLQELATCWPENAEAIISFPATRLETAASPLDEASKQWALRLLDSIGPEFDRKQLIAAASTRP
jgi:tetratricopeptide (TPR) repeat protein